MKEETEEQKKASVEPVSEEPEECSHVALIDTGVGYYHCLACDEGWTYSEWDKMKCEELEETAMAAGYNSFRKVSNGTEKHAYVSGWQAGINWYKKQQEGK